MTYLLYLIVFIVFLPLALQIILGPIIIRFVLKQPAHPHFEECELGEFPSKTQGFFLKSVKALEQEGFEFITYCVWRAQSKIYLALLKNRETHDVASTVSPQDSNFYVEFTTEFKKKGIIDTNNNPQVGVFPPVPDKRLYSFPSIRSVHQLYVLHQVLIQKHASHAEAIALSDEMEIKEVEKAIVKDLERQVETGYFYLDAAAAAYRPTLKGALIMTWKLVWPIGAIRKKWLTHREKAQIKALLEEHGHRV